MHCVCVICYVAEGTFTNNTSVCAKHSDMNRATSCVSILRSREDYSLLPGGHVTIHFNQLVVADSVTISKYGFLTLCEVDVLGTEVVLTPEGLFFFRLSYIFALFCETICIIFRRLF